MPINLKHERRADRRYPLTAELDYRMAGDRGQLKTGHGQTIDISRHCVCFSTVEPVPAGMLIELSIAWPARLDGTVALSLLITGTTTRVEGDCVAVRIRRYGFRTRRSVPTVPPFSADNKVAEQVAPATGPRSWNERNRT
jgi:hypothetical protein